MVRPNLGTLGLQSALRPQADPVNTYYRPNLSGPALRTITDLSPLSSTLMGILKQKSDENKERERVRGQSFAVDNPELARQINEEAGRHSDPEERRKALQNTFAGLVAKGVIDEQASPFFQIGFAQSSAKSVMGEYRNRLNAQLDSLTTVLEDESGLPVEPANIDDVLQSTFDELSGNAALQNFYGRQVSNGLKESIDVEFRQRVADARGKAISVAHRDNLRTDLAQRWDTLALQDEITPDDLSGLAEFITTEVHDGSVRAPRELVLESIQLAAMRASEVDADEALRLLDSAEQLQIGGVTMGDDAVVGLKLAKMKRDFMIQSERDEEKALRNEQRGIQEALTAGELEYVGPMLEAQQNGDSIHQTFLRMRDEIQAEQPWGKYTPLVLDRMAEYKRGLERAESTDREIIDGLEFALADGENIEPLLRSAQAEGRILGEDFARYRARNEERQSIVRDVETNPAYQAAIGEIGREFQRVTGLSPEAQGRYDEFTDGLFQEWKDGYVAVVLDTKGDPDAEKAQRAYLTEKTRELRATVRERESTLLSGRSEFEAQFGEQVARRQDAGQLIDQALAAGTVNASEAQELRRQNDRASDRTPFFRADSYREVLSAVDTALEVTEDEAVLNATPVELLDIREALQDQVEARANAWLDENLATTEPRHLDQSFRGALREIQAEVLEDLVPSSVRRRVAARSDESVTEAADVVTRRRMDAERSDALTAQQAQGAVTLDAFPARSPLVGKGVYERAVKYLNAEDPLFGSPVRRSEVDFLFAQDYSEAVGSGASEDERREAYLSYSALMGLDPEELIAGSATVRMPDDVRAEAQETLAIKQRVSQHGPARVREDVDRQILDILENQLFEHEIDISGADIQPFSTPVFRSIPQMREWKEDRPADWAKLLRRLGFEPDSEEERQFMKHQATAVRRISLP